MIPKVKIFNNKNGYTVVYLKKGLFRDIWKPFTHFMGRPNMPYYYPNYKTALEGAILQLKEIIRHESADY